MAEMNTIVEGNVKYRDGKKWKPRWCVMKKPSPVADRLLVHLFKDVKESVKGGHPKTSFPLDGFYGLESGICFDKETSVLAIICHKQITLLAFSSREILIQFEIKIRRSLGEEHQFPVRTIKVPSNSKLPLDLLRMHIHGQKFCLTGQVPPKILQSWQVTELRRFGTIDAKFCFEGGSRCGKGQGFHVIQTDQAGDITEIFSHASKGKAAPLIQRQTSKRRSELLEPMKDVVSDNLFKRFTSTDQCTEEDSSWTRHKRHSISFTDYRRAKSYADKQRLQSIENVEKERLMAIYDVPPRRIRKVESVKNCENSHPAARSCDLNKSTSRNSQNVENVLNATWSGEYNNNVMSFQVPMTTAASNQSDSSSSSHGSHLSLISITSLPQTSAMPMSSSAPALCGYGNQAYASRYREYSQSVPDQIAEEVDRMVGEVRREEVLQKLQQSEQDLEKEMSLLDEMLQICQKENLRSELEMTQHPPPLPVKLSALREKLSEVVSTRRSLDNLSISSAPAAGSPGNGPLSPNLSKKLRKIPKKSKMSAPLPYVNLSKYDVGDVDTNHVHIPAASTSAPDGTSSLSGLQRGRSKGYDNVPDGSGANKENRRISVSLPGSRENLRNISGSDLQLNVNMSVRNSTSSSSSNNTSNTNSNYSNYSNCCNFMNEPIYANENFEPPPPELPPKGPALKMRQKRVLTAASRPPPPPRPPDRQRVESSRLQYKSSHNSSTTVSSSSSQDEDYFMMGNFDKEPTHCIMTFPESQRLNESLSGRPVVKLPPRGSVQAMNEDQNACYIDMSTQMDLERSRSFNEADAASGTGNVNRPKYYRSHSASNTAVKMSEAQTLPAKTPPGPRTESHCCSAGNSPREVRREKPIREQNYMLMTSVSPKRPVLENLRTLQDYVSATSGPSDAVCKDPEYETIQKCLKFGADELNDSGASLNVTRTSGSSSSLEEDAAKVERPFDNLIGFTNLPSQNVQSSNKAGANVGNEKSDTPVIKTQGFFSRLMRRNSKDRKSISQSHENLIGDPSDATVKEGMAVLAESSSSSGGSSRSQSQQDLVLAPKDRNRSSSFPNRSSFIAMNDSNSSSSTGISILSQHSDLDATNSSLNSCGTISTRASSNEAHLEDLAAGDSVLSDSEKEEVKGNYEKQSYFFMGPLEQMDQKVCNDDELDDDNETDKDTCSKNIDEDFDKDAKEFTPDRNGGKVFTVLSVQTGELDKNMCKTDDEKLIELWQSTHSLNSDKSDKIADLKSKMTLPLEELSPDEKANAIARHISSLPPFVPPKMKSYPVKLSPVLERTTPKKDKPEPLAGLDREALERAAATEGSPVLSPVLMKQQAKATLRITPPSEDENGKIWIPRSSVKEEEAPQESTTMKPTTLVVDVDDLADTDTLSLSSHEGSNYSEEMVRSSPAATILRPRSGKEYQKVERRRTLDDSNTTSPLMTPQSPCTGSVFTFETSYPNTSSTMGAPCSTIDRASLTASLRSDMVQSPRAMYMNLDFSPPESPHLLTEPVEPQLNYAEIDLSDSGRSEAQSQLRRLNFMEAELNERLGSMRPSKKGKSKEPEPVPIEYSMIDMVATRAAQKARKEHAQNRDGSLQRERFLSTSSSTNSRSASKPPKLDRKQSSVTANSGQSSSSMESST